MFLFKDVADSDAGLQLPIIEVSSRIMRGVQSINCKQYSMSFHVLKYE